MDFGKLRHRVTIQRPTETENDFGKPDRTYATLGTARRSASVTGRGGQEKRIAEQMAATADYMVEMRADSVTKGLLPTDRLVWHAPSGTDITLGIVFVNLAMSHRGVVQVQCEQTRD